MKIVDKNRSNLILLAAFAGLLGGCLSDEIADPDLATTTPPPTNSNTAPRISGNPQNAVTAGDSYDFMPTASDSNGDPLTFSIENKPAWVTFSNSTGRLTGQPLLGDVGFFDRIVVTVSDGVTTSSLPAFSITVVQGALGSMELSWTAPLENSDGTALTDLAGYRIYYGVSEGNYLNRIVIDTPGLSTFVVENLLPDTYFVVATSVNSTGVESEFSNVVTKVVDAT